MQILTYLFADRLRHPVQSRRFWHYWIKRIYLLPSLISAEWEIRCIRRAGAMIGPMTFLSNLRLDGSPQNLVIGSHCSIGRVEIFLHDSVVIEDRVVINDGVIILTASHVLSDPRWRTKTRPVKIGRYAWIASGAMILPGVTVGQGAVVGAGTVVRENVPEFAVVIGNPAQSTGVTRPKNLSYEPGRMRALCEAWLGPPS